MLAGARLMTDISLSPTRGTRIELQIPVEVGSAMMVVVPQDSRNSAIML